MTSHSTQWLVPLLLLAVAGWCPAADAPGVRTVRVPDSGVQPQAVVDEKGVVHLIYLKGEAGHSDIFYVRSTDGGRTFSRPARVNSQAGSAMQIGTVRGAHLALGKGASLHIAWFGSFPVEMKAGKATPMLYTRSVDGGASFEAQRNVIQSHPGLDGGGSVAADNLGNVYVAWHAPLAKGEGEQSRRVWLSRSTDGGRTFAEETSISPETGACGCCGLRLLAADGMIYALYRSADQKMTRDMMLLRLDAKSNVPRADIVGKMQSPTCVMSTSAMTTDSRGKVLAAWETSGQMFWSPIGGADAPVSAIAAPGNGGGRKHPALAANATGQVLLVWTEGTGWQKGGSIAWQIYDASGQPMEGGAGRADRLPAWGTPAAIARPDGSFVIVY